MPVCLAAFLALPGNVWAHQDVLEAIALISVRLDQHPSAELYLERGELRRQHGEYAAALADFARAAQFTADAPEIDLARGRVMLEAGRVEAAEMYLLELIRKLPESTEAHCLMGELCEGRHQYLRAAAEYAKAAQFSPSPAPDLILARARVLVAAGDEYVPLALKALDQGMKRLGGPLVSLQTAAIDLELRRANVDAALGRLDALSGQSAPNPQWLIRRAEILRDAGRRDQAKAACRQALEAMGRLPAGRQQTQMMLGLKKQIDTLLIQLDRTPVQTQPAVNAK